MLLDLSGNEREESEKRRWAWQTETRAKRRRGRERGGRVVHGNCLALCTKSFLIFRACRYKAVAVVVAVVCVVVAAAPWVLYYNLTFLLLQHFCLCVCLWLTK